MPESRVKFWTPTIGSACGIAEYTEYLNKYIGAQIYKDLPPDLPPDSLLHVQHEYSYFNAPGRFAAYLYKMCNLRSIPYVITQHTTVTEEKPEAFELYPGATVVHTRRQYDVVASRSPMPVALIPQGVLDMGARARSRGTGKVLGAFGFMGTAKGFDKILDFLIQRPDYSLRLYAHFGSDRNFYNKMAERMEPMPNVHWESDFQPISVVAEKLQRESDLIVYWYRQPHYLSASGATNIGLSTGVPVVGSQTSWFEDLPVVTGKNLHDTILSVMENPQLYHQQSEAQLEYAWENRWEVTAERHRALWDELMENSHGS